MGATSYALVQYEAILSVLKRILLIGDLNASPLRTPICLHKRQVHRVVVHQAHINNLVNSQRIFKNSFTDTLCGKFAIKLSLKSHHTLSTSLHYLVKHE